MNINTLTLRSRLAIARGAIAALALTAGTSTALAQDPDAAAKAIDEAKAVKPNTVDVGLGGVSDGSFKAGEYNGLQKSGAFGVLNFDLRSRTPYDSDNALRWRARGTDLGLETRRIAADVGVQGKFRLAFVYDELLRNRSDSFQTPYNGDGTNNLTLPGTWKVPMIASPAGTTTSARGLVPAIGDAPYLSTAAANQGALITPTAAQKSIVDAAAAADVPLFHNVNLSTKRTRADISAAYAFSDKWSVDGSVRPEHKDGLKPLGTVSRSTGGDISTIIPDKIDQDHNQANANLNVTGKKGYAQVGYYGSYFTNNVSSMSWQNWATGPTPTGPNGTTETGTTNRMSSAPSNTFVQFNGSGAVKVSTTTKLVVNGAYGRGTQNEAFLVDASTPVVPTASLHGLVVNSHFNARLTARPKKGVNLTAFYKFNNRDNQTPVYIYQYSDAGQLVAPNSTLFPAGSANPLGAVVAQNANANRPYSRKSNQLTADLDYALAKSQWIKAGYDYEHIARACPGSWIACADAATTNESTLRAEWRTSGYLLNARVDYAYSARRTPNYNENAFLALVPYANVSPVGSVGVGATGGATAYSFMLANGWTGYGPVLGYAATTGNMNVFFPSNNAMSNTAYANLNRISELIGMRRFYVADRNRNKLRTMLNYQATDALSFQGGVDLNKDDYSDSIYGLQHVKGWAANLQGTYAVAADISADVFYTYENQSMVSAGNSYTANSNVSTITNGQPGAVGLAGNGCDGYTTLLQRNNNNKIDPCLNWSTDMPMSANTVGVGLTRRAEKVDLGANLIFTRVRWDNNVTGGNWANNPLNGLGGPPTTIAAYFIPATPVPTVTTDSFELRLNGKVAIAPHQALRLAYAYLYMNSADYAYEGMQIGLGTISGVLPTNEQAFNYKVNMASVSYVVTF